MLGKSDVTKHLTHAVQVFVVFSLKFLQSFDFMDWFQFYPCSLDFVKAAPHFQTPEFVSVDPIESGCF